MSFNHGQYDLVVGELCFDAGFHLLNHQPTVRLFRRPSTHFAFGPPYSGGITQVFLMPFMGDASHRLLNAHGKVHFAGPSTITAKETLDGFAK